ncbi:hypothetical protein HYW75_05830 [Candidatus Pacearchaeota archaeon]|nr:hypothetical protein [Candidatus Pacearchaeota archaeon]
MNIEDYLLKREHFPIQTCKSTDKKGRTFFVLDDIEIPPYHPSIADSGLPFELVPDLLCKVVEETVSDLEEIKHKINYAQIIIDDLAKHKVKRRVLFEPQIIERDNLGIEIDSIPIADHIYVGRKRINPSCYNGDRGITIDSELSPSSFHVPKTVKFSLELMNEYDMQLEYVDSDKNEIKCSYLWYRHNLDSWDTIFYKNLVIAINNSIVRDKYLKTDARTSGGK